ncbi:Long-chain fatty acid transport protein 4 [Araneus ventricosus]|uniref:Long-chain-fatty-acid--CoA ligase n=1 Tax=Araneus ventricosus TaxID=182803 RepID=A0A4Y2FYF5_ARAVE|nr:Long-chain fatty acid transport protein 4 [Araneus ventricosus]
MPTAKLRHWARAEALTIDGHGRGLQNLFYAHCGANPIEKLRHWVEGGATIGLIYLLSTEMPAPKAIFRTFGRDIKGAYLYFKMLLFLKKCHVLDKTMLDYFRMNCQQYKHRTCFIFQDEKWTFQMVDELSNKIANYFLSIGYSKGDEAALLLENCPEFVCIWLGLAKIGAVTALINTNLKGDTLGHSVTCINAKALIFGRNFAEEVNHAMPFLKKNDSMDFYCFTEQGAPAESVVPFPAKSLNAVLEETSSKPVDPQKHKAGFRDKLMYIYTSGTTGLPKAAIIRHSKFLWMGSCIFVAWSV